MDLSLDAEALGIGISGSGPTSMDLGMGTRGLGSEHRGHELGLNGLGSGRWRPGDLRTIVEISLPKRRV